MNLEALFNTPRSRREVIAKGAVAATTAALLVGVPTLDLFRVTKAEAAEGISGQAENPIRAGYYFPAGNGLVELLAKFGDFHLQRTGENIHGQLLLFTDPFPAWTAEHPTWAGLCSGYSANQAIEKYIPQANNGFTPEQIDGIGSVLNSGNDWVKEKIDGQPVNINKYNTPIFTHLMLRNRLVINGEGLVVNRSDAPDEVWTNPIKDVDMQIKPLNDSGVVEVVANLRVGNYLESPQYGLPYRRFTLAYRVNELDMTDPGVFLPNKSNMTLRSIYRPNPDPARWFGVIDNSRPNSTARVRGKIFTASAEQSFRVLTGEAA